MGGARRRQTLIDIASSLLLTVLVWPFPLARASLTAGSHVVALIVAWQVVQVTYYSVTAGVWGKTSGMRLAGLELTDVDRAGPASARRRALWGIVSAVTAWGTVFSAHDDGVDAAERVASVRVRQAG